MREIAQLLMCPLMQSGDKLLPLKAKPNQLRSVIPVTMLFGFKGVRLTSNKTSIQSHSHMFARTHICTLSYAAGLGPKSSLSSANISGLCHQKATKTSPQNSAYYHRVWGLRVFEIAATYPLKHWL